MGQWAWYAVQKGRQPGVYRTWDECEAQIKGFGGARFKGFKTREGAEGYVRGGTGAHGGGASAVMTAAASEIVVSSSAPVRSVNRLSATTAAVATPPASTLKPGSSAPIRGIIGLSSEVLSSLLKLDPPSTPARTINGLSTASSSPAAPAAPLIPSSSTPTRTINGLSTVVQSQAASPKPGPSTPARSINGLSTAAAAAKPPARSSLPGPSPSPGLGAGGGHFSQFESQGFKPDNSAPFSQEFERLSSSQGWKPGSQEYNRERARALSNELRTHYFSSAPPPPPVKEEKEDIQPLAAIKEEEDEDTVVLAAIKNEGGDEGKYGASFIRDERHQRDEALYELHGFQNMCREVGKEPAATLEGCRAALKETLVNIVDLIDVHRTGRKVEVWDDFVEFMHYTLQPKKTMPVEAAKEDPLLKCFLKDFRGYPLRHTIRGARKTRRKRPASDWMPAHGSKRKRSD